MHAISHTLAHRGPGASRARSRWQPYSSTLNPTHTRSPQSYLHTPASSILSSSPAYISPVCQLDQARKQTPTTQQQPPCPGASSRDAQKSKHAIRLVDQAVKSLCDSWHPEDIPTTFRTVPSTPLTAVSDKPCAPQEVPLIHLHMRNLQLPSPISPSTDTSSFTSLAPNATASNDCARNNHMIPIRGFVHEVLRRSRTSTGVLQTALCYLEAVRRKVPTILQQEQAKEANLQDETYEECVERIVFGTEAEIEESRASSTCLECLDSGVGTSDAATTARTFDMYPEGLLTAPATEVMSSMETEVPAAPPVQQATSKTPSAPLSPLPRLPSPLLCPRRTFLACLILASKFNQDKSYSNKAWAKLAGLPPREIGRCERALGEALEWRLWVGKCSSPPNATSPAVGSHRAVARCKSELNIQRPTCTWPTPTAPVSMFSSTHAAPTRTSSGLRRSATMPELESTSRESIISYSDEAMLLDLQGDSLPTLVAEPDVDEFSTAAGLATMLRASNYATDSPSAVSTPGLVYSPMSTSSIASSDDGERTIPVSGLRALYPSFGDLASFRPSKMADCASWASDFGNARLPSLEPFVANAPVLLAPLSEAVSNPALLERSVGHFEGAMGHYVVGDSFFSVPPNWSVSDGH